MYNYKEVVEECVRDLLNETEERDFDRLYEIMINSDGVTGNASGSFFCNCFRAKECVLANIELLKDAYDGDYEALGRDFYNEAWEAMDVYIRISLLYNVLEDVLDEEE